MARAEKVAARLQPKNQDSDTGNCFNILREFADRRHGGDIQACAGALDEQIKCDTLPDDVAELLKAMRTQGGAGFSPEEYIASLSRILEEYIAPGSLALSADQRPAPDMTP